MTETTAWRGRWQRSSGPRWMVGAIVLLGVEVTGCGGDNAGNPPPDGGTTTSDSGPTTGDSGTTSDSSADASDDSSTATESGTGDATSADSEAGVPADDGKFGTVTAVTSGTAYRSPFDATPDPTGTTVYFTAAAPDGTTGVFSVAASGSGTVTSLSTGTPFVSPFGIAISADGKTLFIADVGAAEDPTAVGKDQGVIFSLPVAGGTPTLLVGSVSPRSLEVVGSTLYFSGIDKTNGKSGVFSVSTAGGATTVVAEGAPFVDPSGVAADATGNVYVVDTLSSGSQRGVVYKIIGGTVTALASDVFIGYPAGLALSGDGTALLASTLTPGGTDQISRVLLADGSVTNTTTGPFSTGTEAAGLHRAHAAYAYAWADSTIGGGTGTVYLLSK